MEQVLRALCFNEPTAWVDKLPYANFIISDTESATTKVTPFFAAHGHHPRQLLEPPSTED
ncbi:hypothetical protein EJ08DRAFT_726297 [Tothia fuscella]|uniref:Uncharacterized protein n=1 Tax=Tothia fuscella TaxID=1048955 RepID=A0A9P4NHR5_9PEZI|nr:hypothetical protein EJ08DRAFT_726297 [Tothia fuscella]